MNKRIYGYCRPLVWTIMMACFGLLSSCKEEPEIANPSVISFEEEVYVYSESDVFAFIPVQMDRPQFSYVSYNLEATNANATTNPGETLEVTYGVVFPKVIYGGNQTTGIHIYMYNDADVDGEDEIEVSLIPKTTNAKADPERGKVRIIVEDDDNVPADELHIHANWLPQSYAIAGKPFLSEYDVTLNLLYDVVLDDDGIAESNVFKQSSHTDKYQDIVLSASDPDREYYLQFVYNGLESSIKNTSITGKLKLNGFGHADGNGNVWTFTLEEDGYYVYLGPFKKEGATFTLLED